MPKKPNDSGASQEPPQPKAVRGVDISTHGNVLRVKQTVKFGGAGLPLSELGRLKGALKTGVALPETQPVKTGRNEPCPCGSGKNFKKCCGS